MRRTLWLVALACAAFGQEQDSPKKTRVIKGPEGRVSVTAPATWKDAEIAGNMILRAIAPGTYGGHDLRIDREEGQGDVDKQRDRYLAYDSGNAPNGTVLKLTKPFFGYRLDNPSKNRVLCRAFVSDGADGLVITVASRFQYYDKLWAGQVVDVLASVSVEGKPGGATPELSGELRRLFDTLARVSLVAPSSWKRLKPEHEMDLLFVALKGARKGPRFVIRDWGPRLNPGLTLLKISSRWKRAYNNLLVKRLGNDPPRMTVTNRVPGSVDYLIAFENQGRGYTLMMTVREGGFEKFKTLADDVARTVVFSGAPYRAPQPDEKELGETYKNLAAVHANVEQTGTLNAVLKALPAFEKHWSKIGVGYSRKAPPMQIVVSTRQDFANQSHHFGRPPAAYDRVAHVVVVTPRPKQKQQQALWRGRLYYALAENALERDIAVGPPTWLRAGLAACMEAAGRTGKTPREAHPALVERLTVKTSTDAHKSLGEIFAMTDADVYLAETPNMRVHAWGYVHLMLYGKGSLGSIYKKWARALVRARGRRPDFNLRKYAKAEEDLKKHAFKNWEKK